jgi:hypothetical protein
VERFQQRFLSKRWQKVLLILSGIVVFVTTYALILPAITIDTDVAESEPGLEVVLQDETAGETGETLEDEAPLPPTVMDDTNGDVSVKVEAEAGVFPEGTRLVLGTVDDRQVIDSIEGAVSDYVKNVQAVEIAFENDLGEQVLPQSDYTLTVEPVEPQADAPQVLVSVDKDGAASVMDTAGTDAALMVVSPEDAPVVALVETETLKSTFLSANGNVYDVTVTYTQAAGIPENAALS